VKKKEEWLQLCEQAANEQDPAKLMKLIAEIDRLLAEKEQRLNAARSAQGNSNPVDEGGTSNSS
jgi:hypothetical protein